MAQSVEPLTLAQVMILWFVRAALGSVLTAQSLEPASDSWKNVSLSEEGCLPLSALSPLLLSLKYE